MAVVWGDCDRWEGTVRNVARAALLVGSVVVVGLLAQILFSGVIAPQLLIKRIVVYGDLPLSSVELTRIAGLDGTDHLFDVDTQAIAERLGAHPMVRTASVRTRIPGTLEVTVVRRRPLAMSLATIDDRSVPVVFDESGVIIEVDPGTTPELPVLSGLRFVGPRPGVTLPEELLPAVAALAAIRDRDPKLYGVISELVVSTTDAGALDLSFYPSTYPVAVRLGPHLHLEAIKHAFVALDVLGAAGIDAMPPEIDFRAGEAVYREPAATSSRVAGLVGARG